VLVPVRDAYPEIEKEYLWLEPVKTLLVVRFLFFLSQFVQGGCPYKSWLEPD